MLILKIILTQAFQDLQSKKLDAQQKLRTADIQAELQKQLIRRCDLTKQELLSMPTTVPTYQSVGRMFIKQNMDDTLTQLDEKIVTAEEKIKTLEVCCLLQANFTFNSSFVVCRAVNHI